ncbi:methyl farnesoate epoxidase-like [Artemia franciscana]|uniref:methyl farnesoate epoxidase-like n=1 Tax=Artemia franciscana TaxID=6661 RepID=UPI0032DB6620
MITETLGAIGLGLIAIKLAWRPSKYPPGPRGLPFVGYAPFFTKMDPNYPYLAMTKLAEKYGPVIGVYLGQDAHIFVASAEAAKETYFNEDLNGKPNHPVFQERSEDKKHSRGIMFWDGPAWLEQRRFQLRELRDLGWGKITTETVAQEEIRELLNFVSKVSKTSNGAVDLHGELTVSVINILWTIVAGKRYNRDDEEFVEFLGQITAMFRSGVKVTNYVIPFPFLRHIVPGLVGWNEFRDCNQAMRRFFKKAIDEHRQTLPEQPRDFIDIYLKRMMEEEKKGTAKQNGFLEDQLIVSIIDIFGAGAESTSNQVGFLLIHMIRNPGVQQKVQEEIDKVVGKDRLPSLNDRPSMPYTEAVIMEVMRMSNIAMQTVPRRAMRDTTLMGYYIPKDTFVHISVWAAHMDKTYWVDPENFRPERHIGEDGKLKKHGFNLMPFGFGKRSCAGEALARSTVFLFFTSLLQSYTFSFLPGQSRPTIKPDPGFTQAPKPFTALVTPR